MARKIIDKNDLDIFKQIKPMGSGEESFCYFVPGTSDIIKIYHEGKELSHIKFDDKVSSYIAFPKDVFIDKETNKIIANTMPFLPGLIIQNGFPEDLEIEKLKEAYSILYQELVTFGDIYMVDLCLDNIFYDIQSNRFYLFDTGRWQELIDVSSLNRVRIDLNLSAALYRSGLSWLKDYPDLREENPKLYSFYISSKDERYCPFLEYLDALVEEIEKKFGQEVRTIGDLGRKVYKKS